MKGIVFLLAFLSCGVGVGQESTMKVEAAGVTLIWGEVDQKAFEYMSILNSQRPVAMALMVKAGGKTIVSLDKEGSKVSSLTDDQETNLKGKIGVFPSIAKDGSAAVIQVEGEKAVSPQAETLIAKGSLKLMVGSKRAATRSKVTEAKKGAILTIDDKMAFSLSSAGKPDWGDDPFSVTLEIKRDIPEVAKIRFFDEKGEEIEASRGGSSRSGFLGKVTVNRTYNFKRKADKISVEVDRWTDLEEVEVPFDLNIGIGGAK